LRAVEWYDIFNRIWRAVEWYESLVQDSKVEDMFNSRSRETPWDFPGISVSLLQIPRGLPKNNNNNKNNMFIIIVVI